MSEHLAVGGHLVLCLADRNPETSDGITAVESRRDVGGVVRISVDLETFFLVNSRAWQETGEDEQLLVFIPGPLGADVQLRAPKRLFREVHVQP